MTNVAVVVNPVKVADIDELRRKVAEWTARAALGDALWLETTQEDPGAGMVAEALRAGVQLVVVCGGDGTVTACADALAEAGSDVAMAIVPAGTGNLLARNLRLPLELDAALDVAFGSDRVMLDVLDAGDKRYLVMAGLGFDAAMIRETDEELKGRIGWPAYLGGFVRAFRRSPRIGFTVEVEGSPPLRRKAVGVLVGNVGELQSGLAVLPDARPDDGLLDVIVLAPRRALDYVVLIWQIVRRTAHRGPHADVLRGTAVTVRADKAIPVQFDGDFDGERQELSVRVLPGKLSLCASSLRWGRSDI